MARMRRKRQTITEDSPQWDPRTMGNKRYGPGAVFPKAPPGTKFQSRAGSVSGSRRRVASHGTGPGPKGSYPPYSQRMKKAISRRLTQEVNDPRRARRGGKRKYFSEDDRPATWISGRTGGTVSGPLSSMVGTQGDVRQRGRRRRG